jgi:hypothetical protein
MLMGMLKCCGKHAPCTAHLMRTALHDMESIRLEGVLLAKLQNMVCSMNQQHIQGNDVW